MTLAELSQGVQPGRAPPETAHQECALTNYLLVASVPSDATDTDTDTGRLVCVGLGATPSVCKSRHATSCAHPRQLAGAARPNPADLATKTYTVLELLWDYRRQVTASKNSAADKNTLYAILDSIAMAAAAKTATS